MNIVEFAKLAKLSTATISRAFHEPEKIRPATRQRVLELADRLGYYPSASGRALVKGRHDVLGLVWPLEVEGAGAPFAQRVLAALTQQLVSNDLDLLICPVDRRQAGTMEHARRTVLRSRCDAWILLYTRKDDFLVDALRKSRKPVICLMSEIAEMVKREGWRSVTLDQRSWIEDALGRLQRSGARRVLFVGGREAEPDHEQRLALFQERAPHYFGENALTYPRWPLDEAELGALLRRKAVDAVIGVDDTTALAVARACRQAKLSIPGEVQIIGIDASAEASCFEPSLATYLQPLDEMAACTVELALGKREVSRQFSARFVPGGSVRGNR